MKYVYDTNIFIYYLADDDQYKIKIPDAIIAATTLSQNGCLVTRNVDDFKEISGLNIKNPFIDEG